MKIQHSKQWSIHSLRIVLTALYIVSIVPLLIMAFFSYPVADDFAMAVDVHAAYAATGASARRSFRCFQKSMHTNPNKITPHIGTK